MSRKRDQEAAVPAAAARVRLDVWLWAARFYKTRSLAKAAIEGGKVHCNGERCKGSKTIGIGMRLDIRQGYDEKVVLVKALSDTRRGAPEAALLYEETPESITRRLEQAEQRKAMNAAMNTAAGKPTRQDRRRIQSFKRDIS
jgi:ribosome-associated heat shock protein Hsp15